MQQQESVISGVIPLRSHLHSGYSHPLLREWQKEKTLTKSSLMFPLFITDSPDAITPVASLPGVSRFGLATIVEYLTPLVKDGLKSVLIFGVPENIQKVLLY